jgi:GTP-binding protein
MSVATIDQLPNDGLPEIALAGRSNVGKSSMINALLGRPGLARTSNTPGRTQTLNYYRITPRERPESPFYLVDMPGYGYAATNLANREKWGVLINEYFDTRTVLCGIVQLVDLRHEPQPLDHTMSEWLRDQEHPYLVVGNKADKLSKGKVVQSINLIAKELQIDIDDAVAFSAQTGFGKEKLWNWILETSGSLSADIE